MNKKTEKTESINLLMLKKLKAIITESSQLHFNFSALANEFENTFNCIKGTNSIIIELLRNGLSSYKDNYKDTIKLNLQSFFDQSDIILENNQKNIRNIVENEQNNILNRFGTTLFNI